MPAILQRPDPIAIQAARPDQQQPEPARGRRRGLVAEHLAGRRLNGGDGVRALVCVRSEHDHDPCPRPFHLGCETARRTRLAGGGATLLSSHAGSSPTGDERHNKRKSDPTGSTASKRVSSPPGRDLLPGVGRHRGTGSKQQASMRQRARVGRPARATFEIAARAPQIYPLATSDVRRGPLTFTFSVAGLPPPSRPRRGSRGVRKAGVGGHRDRRRSRRPAQHRRPGRSPAR